jgi:hypothetical protein
MQGGTGDIDTGMFQTAIVQIGFTLSFAKACTIRNLTLKRLDYITRDFTSISLISCQFLRLFTPSPKKDSNKFKKQKAQAKPGKCSPVRQGAGL